MREELPAALAGERLDRVVSILTGCSRAEAAMLVAGGAVRIGGEPVLAGKHKVAEGDVVEVEAPDTPAQTLAPDPSVAFPVVHEDADVLVIDKPAGLVVHPGAGTRTGTLVHGLLARYPDLAGVGEPDRPGIVHRLDRDTSGLLVVARTEAAREALMGDLAERSVTREYLALVWGVPASPAGMVDAPVGRSSRSPTRMAVSARGREARTRYRVEESWPDRDVALLRCVLETGRTHQIRVHLAAIGHPVVGDVQYGGQREGQPSPRLFLHATRLAFDHPSTGERLTFDSPLPPDLAAARASLAAGG